MRIWNPITIVIALMVILTMSVPMSTMDSDAASGDIVLYTNTTSIDLLSNSSDTFEINIGNYSINDDTFDVKLEATHENDSYSVSFSTSEFILGKGDIQTITVTLGTIKYATKDSGPLTISAECFGMGGSNNVVSENLTITVNTFSTYNNEESFNNILGMFDNPLPSPFNAPISTALITLLIWIIAGTIISIAAAILIYHLIFRREKSDTGDARKRLNQMRKFIFGIVILYGLANSMNVFGIDVEIVGAFTELSQFLFVIFGGIIVWKIVRVEIEAIGRRAGNDGRFDPSIIPLFLIIAEVIIVLITVSVALAVYGVNLVSIITTLGLLTTGLSLGAKNIINQFLSGVILLAERPFVKDDKIKMDVDVSTTLVVDKVGYMTTRFKSWSNEEMVTIPNNTIMNGTMTNMTRDNVLYRVYDYYSVSYDTDVSKAKEIMMEKALASPDVIVDQMMDSPIITFDNVDRNCINLRLSYIVNDHENYGSIAGRIRHEIFNAFCKNDIEIPYNQYSINLVRLKRVEPEAE